MRNRFQCNQIPPSNCTWEGIGLMIFSPVVARDTNPPQPQIYNNTNLNVSIKKFDE